MIGLLRALLLGWPFAKAVIMTSAVAALAGNEPFWHQVLLVIISAVISAGGMIIAARWGAARVEERVEEEHTRTRKSLADLKKAGGVARREDDRPEQAPKA